MRTRFTLMTALALLSGGKAMVASAEEHGLVEDSTLNVLSRNFFLHNDYRTGHSDQSYRQEWAQGFIANFQSASPRDRSA